MKMDISELLDKKEFEKYKEARDRLAKLLFHCEAARIIELIEADKEGRLIVLPKR